MINFERAALYEKSIDNAANQAQRELRAERQRSAQNLQGN